MTNVDGSRSIRPWNKFEFFKAMRIFHVWTTLWWEVQTWKKSDSNLPGRNDIREAYMSSDKAAYFSDPLSWRFHPLLCEFLIFLPWYPNDADPYLWQASKSALCCPPCSEHGRWTIYGSRCYWRSWWVLDTTTHICQGREQSFHWITNFWSFINYSSWGY